MCVVNVGSYIFVSAVTNSCFLSRTFTSIILSNLVVKMVEYLQNNIFSCSFCNVAVWQAMKAKPCGCLLCMDCKTRDKCLVHGGMIVQEVCMDVEMQKWIDEILMVRCNACQKEMNIKTYQEVHYKEHVKVVPCNYCFSSCDERDMDLHLKQDHKDYCNICSKNKVGPEHDKEFLFVHIKKIWEKMEEMELNIHCNKFAVSNFFEVVWKINDYKRRNKEAVEGTTVSLYSSPFYSYSYKFCLRLYLNGDGTGKQTHVSYFLCVMRGDRDFLLHWPVQGEVCLGVVNSKDGNTYGETFRMNKDSSSFHFPVHDLNIASGLPMFMRQPVFESTFVQNDEVHMYCKIDLANECRKTKIIKTRKPKTQPVLS